MVLRGAGTGRWTLTLTLLIDNFWYFQPHEVPESYKRSSREKSVTASEEGRSGTAGSRDRKMDSDSDEDVPLVKVKEGRVSTAVYESCNEINCQQGVQLVGQTR